MSCSFHVAVVTHNDSLEPARLGVVARRDVPETRSSIHILRPYFARSADAGAQWRIQALVSRDRRRELRTDDTVSFLHQAPFGQGSVLRLQPQPDDPGRLGAVPGQAWGCWRLKIV